MLGDKLKAGVGGGATTLISKDTELVGDVRFSGTLDVEGIVRGSIVAKDGADALVRIIDKGLVEGDIHAPNIIINGAIVGNVHASKQLELAARARVEGNVYYALVEMEIGAQINGSLEHVPAGSEAAPKAEPNASKAGGAHNQVPRLAAAGGDTSAAD